MPETWSSEQTESGSEPDVIAGVFEPEWWDREARMDPLAELAAFDVGRREAAIPLIRERFRESKNVYAASEALRVVGTPETTEPFLEVFRQAEPTPLEDDGVRVYAETRADGEVAYQLISVPGALDRIRPLCSGDEFERLLITGAAAVANPEWHRALVEIATPRAIGALIYELTITRGGSASEEGQPLVKRSLAQIGKDAHLRILKALQPEYTQAWPRPEARLNFRRDLLDVLNETGDQETVTALQSLSRADGSISDDASTTIAAISTRAGP